jgi:hypothetical protein
MNTSKVTMITETLYPELKEPTMSFAEIVALLMSLTDDQLEMMDDDKFASALITLHH